jgi:Ser/Thr protein kinase RdoA (MazF antagonist)
VANAVAASMPAGSPVGLGMTLTDTSVVVEVFDRAPGEPAPGTATAEAESGRGLHMVAVLSCQVLTHSDWTPDNVLVSDQRTWLIDMAQAAKSWAAYRQAR